MARTRAVNDSVPALRPYRAARDVGRSRPAGILFAIALVLSVHASAEEESRLFRALGWATFATKAGDSISTELALGNGGYEANPFMENRGARVAASVAIPALVNWGTSALYPEHPKLALWTRVAVVAAWGYATAHNLRGAR